MGDTPTTLDGPSQIVRKILAWLSNGWLDILVDLYRYLRHLAPLKQQEGIYEILDYDSTLELVDAKGKTAIFKRHQKVRFLQDNIIAFQDHAWGAGDIFASYKISKGIAVDRYQEGDRWNVVISLRETKSKGDIEDFYIERTVKNGFTGDEEWWQVAIWFKTHKLRLTAIFPKERYCERAVLQSRGNNKTMVLGHEHFQRLPDGRQLLRWELSNPRRPEVYTLRWRW